MKHIRRSLMAGSYALAIIALTLSLLPTAEVLVVPVRAEFSKQVSITQGSPAPRLSDALVTAGYTGAMSMDEMTICDPIANTKSFFLGSNANVNASTGFEIPPGVCVTYRSAARAVNAASFFVFTATTQNAAITLRER